MIAEHATYCNGAAAITSCACSTLTQRVMSQQKSTHRKSRPRHKLLYILPTRQATYFILTQQHPAHAACKSSWAINAEPIRKPLAKGLTRAPERKYWCRIRWLPLRVPQFRRKLAGTVEINRQIPRSRLLMPTTFAPNAMARSSSLHYWLRSAHPSPDCGRRRQAAILFVIQYWKH